MYSDREDGPGLRAFPVMKKDTRGLILDTLWRLVQAEGLGSATTRRIAQAAGIAEGTIYKQFADKSDLLIALVQERVGDVPGIYRRLAEGGAPPRQALAEAVQALTVFFEELHRVTSCMFNAPDLLERLKANFAETDRGPQRGHRAMADYLRREAAAGRLTLRGTPELLAHLLIGAAHEYAFLARVSGAAGSRRELAEGVVAALFPAED